MELRDTRVTIDDAEWSVPCRISGTLWNGWQMPYFTREQAEEVIKRVSGCGYTLAYNAEQDAYVYTSDDCPEDTETYSAIEVDGVKYYAIGAGSWVWDLADPDSNPFEGDFSYHARLLLYALAHRFYSHGWSMNDELTSACMSASGCNGETDPDKLRELIQQAWRRVEENPQIKASEQLLADAKLAAEGGNPWAKDA